MRGYLRKLWVDTTRRMGLPTHGPEGFLTVSTDEGETKESSDNDSSARFVSTGIHMICETLKETWELLEDVEYEAGFKAKPWDVDRPLLSVSGGDLEVGWAYWPPCCLCCSYLIDALNSRCFQPFGLCRLKCWWTSGPSQTGHCSNRYPSKNT